MNKIFNQRVLLLLSGGNDSAQVVEILKQQNCEILGLCISGIQKKEIIGAQQTAEKHGIELMTVEISFFDEETWNPLKLILRDLAMGIVAIYICKKKGIGYLATGVKTSDLSNEKLKWLSGFLKFSKVVLGFINIQLILPLAENGSKVTLQPQSRD